MATLNNGLLGGFSGKVGDFIGSTCRGVEYIKRRPVKMTNPKTKSQTKQRSRFVVTQNFLRTFTPFIRIGFKNFAVNGMSAFNAAMSYNMKNAIKEGSEGNELDYSRVLISRGSLFTTISTNAKVVENKLLIEWDPTIKENASANDQVMVLAFNSTKIESVYDINAGKRSNALTVLELPATWNGDVIETFISFKNEVGTMISDSCNVCINK